ncbi:uncharacterized protein LOC116945426 isoform X7 [Petromyzon marinus]|uniref:uncharacterized protein LOC116945426 isoform X7 n=1 Tax=Petromyzon marinus TaxID=7757 RepID=UPI003F7064FF
MRFMATVENNSFIKGSRQTLGTSFHLQAMQNNSGRLTRCTSADYNSIKALLDAFKYTKAHYHGQDWSQRTEFSVGRNKVKWEPLVDPRKFFTSGASNE